MVEILVLNKTYTSWMNETLMSSEIFPRVQLYENNLQLLLLPIIEYYSRKSHQKKPTIIRCAYRYIIIIIWYTCHYLDRKKNCLAVAMTLQVYVTIDGNYVIKFQLTDVKTRVVYKWCLTFRVKWGSNCMIVHRIFRNRWGKGV